MTRYVLSGILGLLLPMAAASRWVIIPLEPAVKDSDIIVIGTLRNVSGETRDGTAYGAGEIDIDEVLWGDAGAGRKLTLAWQNPAYIDCPRVEHREHANERAIWLLTRKAEGEVAADNPGRFVPVRKKGEVLELLRGRAQSNNGMQRARNEQAFYL